MAIIFLKDVPGDKLLMAYNNNIVKFKSDSTLIPMTAEVSGFGVPVVLYPHPDNTFFFNLKDYLALLVNTNGFADNLTPDLQGDDVSTFTYDVSNGCFYEGEIEFKINFTNSTSETATRQIEALAGVEQLDDYKRNEILFDQTGFAILSPVKDRSNNTVYLKHWEGYPFEFSFYNREHPLSDVTLRNANSGISFDFKSKSKVTSLFLSDGRTDVTLEDFVPLMIGANEIQFLIEDVDQGVTLYLDKVDSECGLYFKFLNKYGRWNYWLFSKNYFRRRSSQYIGEVTTDFANLEDTVSKTIQLGKNSVDSIKCIAERVPVHHKAIIEQIIESPKILLFTGVRFAKSTAMDWMEVKLKTTSLDVKKANTQLYSFEVEFELPDRDTIKL